MDIVDPHYHSLSIWIFKILYYYSKGQTNPINSGTVSHPKSTQITIGQGNFLQFWSVSGHSFQVQLGCILVLLAHLQLGLRWVSDFGSTPGRPARVSNKIKFQGGSMKLLLEVDKWITHLKRGIVDSSDDPFSFIEYVSKHTIFVLLYTWRLKTQEWGGKWVRDSLIVGRF